MALIARIASVCTRRRLGAVRWPLGFSRPRSGCRSFFRYAEETATSWLPILVGVALAAATAAMSGCGGNAPAAQAGSGSVKGRADRPGGGNPDGSACGRQIGDFVGSMATLRHRLAVGVSYDEYSAELRRVRALYDRAPIRRMTIDCLATAGVPAEQALGRYVDAANAWGECLSEAGCDSASIESELQAKWRVASRYLAEAQRGL
jgi:hypothetical protein